MTQRRKTYKGGSPQGCKNLGYKYPWAKYVKNCPALRIDTDDPFYEGALSSAKRWALNQTNLLCNGGYTTIDPVSGSVFTGSSCPAAGTQSSVDVNAVQQGPIPLSGGDMQLGEQVINYECSPNCTVSPEAIVPSSVVLASQLRQYLEQQAAKFGYAKLSDGSVVPEVVVRMGFYLHWVADRASHWWCCDASQSGVAAVKEDSGDYNLYLYLDPLQCNFAIHSMDHYWEQGMGGKGAIHSLAPGSFSALQYIYRALAEFRAEFLDKNPEFFRPGAVPYKESVIVGSTLNPGYLYKIVQIVDANQRFQAEVQALAKLKLPPMPGFEMACQNGETRRLRREGWL